MKIEDIENLWAHQAPAAALGAPPALTAQIRREVRHHYWFRIFLVTISVFSIVVLQALFYVNGRYAAKYNSPLNLASLVLTQTVSLATLYFLLRSLRRNREMLRRRGETVQAVISTALANIESEMLDYRCGYLSVFVGMFTAGFSVYAKFPADWPSLLPRLAFIIVLVGGVAFAIRRHYRKNLVPEHDRLRQTLDELRG